MSVVVVEVGSGNTASVVWALERLGARPRLTSDPTAVAEAERVIFPGVGAAGHVAEQLRARGLDFVLQAFDRPLLGLCLGMQMLFERSEEGDAKGLARLPGVVRRIPAAPDRPSPHMGWNRLDLVDSDDPLLEGVCDGDHVYFVHGYGVLAGPETVASVEYGARYAAVVRQGKLAGCQFHPERSGAVGARILRNFLGSPC